MTQFQYLVKVNRLIKNIEDVTKDAHESLVPKDINIKFSPDITTVSIQFENGLVKEYDL